MPLTEDVAGGTVQKVQILKGQSPRSELSEKHTGLSSRRLEFMSCLKPDIT